MKPYNSTDPKRDQIRSMFNTIAPKYDMLNHLLSFGIDRTWRSKVARRLGCKAPQRILDVATGTGDMAIVLARKNVDAKVVGFDLSEGMLEVARRKVAQASLSSRVELRQGEAERLPFADAEFDAVTVAFGVRNFHDIEQGLREMLRVIRPGGELYVLEFSTPDNKIFGKIYRFYFHRILPFVGGLLSSDGKAYKYLPESVQEFASEKQFSAMMLSAGATKVESVALMSGVARIYIGIK